MLNACTIDVEDYFQVSAFESVVDRAQWGDFPSRVESNTRRILEILDRRGIRATFFIVGWIAERFSHLVREIHDAHHEIGCHSHEHRLVYRMEPRQFRRDLRQAKQAIEAAIDEPVRLYRAPSFSITKRSTWALEILVEEGIEYDSSIFPICHDRYGIANAPIEPYRIQTTSGELTEFPPTVHRVLGWNLPVGGGGYFRLYPYAMTAHCMRRINRAGRGMNLYVHPWEFDPEQPRIAGVSALSRFRHFVRLGSTTAKFDRILAAGRFAPLGDVLRSASHELPQYVLTDGCLRPLRIADADQGEVPARVRSRIC